MRIILSLILLCIGCTTTPVEPKTPVCPEAPKINPAPPCEDNVKIMDEKGVVCPANTKATFPNPFGLLQPGTIVVLCQCK
jgi:hypothetical protein